MRMFGRSASKPDMSEIPTQIIINHSGQAFIFDPASDGKPMVELGDEYHDDKRRLVYEYELSGAHSGPSIKIKMIGIGEDHDEEEGRSLCWDSLVWADSNERIEDVIDDFYADELREDLRIQARETWS